MRLSSVCGLCACMTSLQCLGVLLTRWPTPGQPVVQCCVWWMSQMCSIGFRSGELQASPLIPLSCRNCWHTPASWGLAFDCIRRKPGPIHREVWRSHPGTKLQCLASTWRDVRPSKKMPPHAITDPLPFRSYWRMLGYAINGIFHVKTSFRLASVMHVSSILETVYISMTS